MKKVGIIGAGPGGLAAGLLLLSKGFDVTIFEVKDRVGGRNASITEKGYTFDIGPTFYMMPFILEEIFKEAGRRIHDFVDLVLVDPYYQLVFVDGSTMKPSFYHERVRDSIASINKGDVAGFDGYMEENERKMKYTLPVLQRPFNSWWDMMNKHVLRLLKVLKPTRSLWDGLGTFFTDDRVKVGFTFQSKYLGMSPQKCPSMFSILPYTEYKWGVYHVIGGLNQLSLAMARLITQLGGEIRLNTGVKEVKVKDRQVTGILLDDDSYHSFHEVVMNADFAWGMKNLFPQHLRKKYTDTNLDERDYSCSTFMLYLGVDRPYDHLLHNNVYIAKDYKRNFLEIESDKVLSQDPSFYVQNGSVTDKTLAPEGHAAIYILVPVSNLKGQIDWKKEAKPFRSLILEKVKERVGLEKIEDHIVYEKMITPLDWKEEMRVGYGATFNLAHHLRQMLIFRPHNQFEEFKNMWLVGGGTSPGSGLPTIYESGRITANLIARKHQLNYTFDYQENLAQVFSKS